MAQKEAAIRPQFGRLGCVPMSHRPKKWPHRALDKCEAAIYGLKTIESLARELQEALARGEHMQAFIFAGDIRTKALDAKSELHQARTGDYEP